MFYKFLFYFIQVVLTVNPIKRDLGLFRLTLDYVFVKNICKIISKQRLNNMI